jgi:hypothetical protein
MSKPSKTPPSTACHLLPQAYSSPPEYGGNMFFWNAKALSDLRAITTQKTALFFNYCCLFDDAVNISDMCHQMVGWLPVMNWKGCGRMQSWPNLRYYSSICLVGRRETTKDLSKDTSVPSKIWTGHLTNWSQKHYCFSWFAWQGIWQQNDNWTLSIILGFSLYI